MTRFEENNEKFIEALKSGLRVCEKGSSINIRFEGIACAVEMAIRANSAIMEITKRLLLLAITAWGAAMTDHYGDEKIDIHIRIKYNDDETFSMVNTLDADNIINSISNEDD